MRCPECGGHMETRRGVLQLLDEIAGLLVIDKAEYRVCGKCGIQVYPAMTAARIAKRRTALIREQLEQLPIGQFVTMPQAASILGVSKQAFSKNRRIRAGFIYSVPVGGRVLYFKPSVSRFDRTGDGRFSLWQYGPDGIEATPQEAGQEMFSRDMQSDSAAYAGEPSAIIGRGDWEESPDLAPRSTPMEAAYA